ncbi:helix-turn-helix domain-containing protein [Legionella nagasakiensis]|uniref:helix-turn-helix domain-containing protein n=1 Tax=Legionella nagasakiensis TaxID=535290 RepID=UPI001054FBAC|nr:helix-turn-helix domain-containing protein [Legionella nagasakiensis]
MFKYYNPRLIKQYRSYTIEQICALFTDKKLHPQTVRGWVKSGELEAITKKPIVIYGQVIKEFLENRNATRKQQLAFNQFKCLRCQEIVCPLDNTISLYRNKNGSFQAVGACQFCKTTIRRFYKQNEHLQLEQTFIIQEAEVTTICNPLSSACKTHLNSSQNDALNEPSKTEPDTS